MIKKRIEQLLDALNKGIYEKENELALSLLAAVAGESIIRVIGTGTLIHSFGSMNLSLVISEYFPDNLWALYSNGKHPFSWSISNASVNTLISRPLLTHFFKERLNCPVYIISYMAMGYSSIWEIKS